MNSERELFLYELNGHGYHFKNTDWHDDWERFEDDQLNMAWEMWQASTQRQGYKLVPEKPNANQIEKAVYELNLSGNTDILVDIYIAMIGAVDE